MQSKFYQPDGQRAGKVRELFATIAGRYDLLNDIMSAGFHRRWKQRLVELAGTCPSIRHSETSRHIRGARVLDLCCGTGDIALKFTRNGACVTGLDFTEEMLQVAGARPAYPSGSSAPPPSVSWVRADALHLPFPDGRFDVVSVGYGLRNLADIEQCLAEALRVLQPGGLLLSLDFGKPESPILRPMYYGYLRVVLPALGWLYCGDPDTHGYILASLQNYPAQRGIKLLMERRGYQDCGFEEFWGGTMAINFGSKPMEEASLSTDAKRRETCSDGPTMARNEDRREL
jgi:demethylmenaquinone methyltransferase/2-methoxy-6-polyprenyl-1,4-benzoquinol methylase